MKKSNYGFTLIELMIVLAIVGILSAVGYDGWKKTSGTSGHMGQSKGMQGPASGQSTCVEGFKFVNGAQLKDERGAGVPCSITSQPR